MKRSAPQPPPQAPAPPSKPTRQPKFPTYRVLFDYDGSVAGSVALVKDSVVYVASVNGKWGLVKDLDETYEGWSPMDYMKEIDPPADLFSNNVPKPAPQASSVTTPQAQQATASEPQGNSSERPAMLPTTSSGSGLGNGLADAILAKRVEMSLWQDLSLML